MGVRASVATSVPLCIRMRFPMCPSLLAGEVSTAPRRRMTAFPTRSVWRPAPAPASLKAPQQPAPDRPWLHLRYLARSACVVSAVT